MDKDYSSGMEIPLGQRLRELPGPMLLTGHTGFKGTWMTFLLEHLEVPVVGYSLEPEKDSLFDRAGRFGAIPEIFADIRDYETLEKFIDEKKPSTIIHMAAQPLVLKSYKTPRDTFDVNVMGTVNALDIAFKKDFIKAIIVVTTDKVYRNDNSGRSFVETDPLEGKDPYSASKVGTEAVVAAWQQIAKTSGGPSVVSVRAGNVIGGGDFGENRLIPDLIQSVVLDKMVSIRNPESTRPWQHVLDPLVGYLLSLETLVNGVELPNLNFGPHSKNLTVSQLIEIGRSKFPELSRLINYDVDVFILEEAKLLELNSTLSREILGWESVWSQEQAILKTFDWWQKYLSNFQSAQDICFGEISEYFSSL